MRCVEVVLVAGLLSACGSSKSPAMPDAPTADAAPDAPSYPAFTPPAPQVMSAGGPVLAAPRLVSVSFSDSTDAAQMDSFVAGLAASTWWHVLSEYGVGAVTSTKGIHLAEAAPTTIDDAAIKTWLADKIANDATEFGDPTNTLYVIFYPSTTTTITADSRTLCNQLGAYHTDAPLTGGGTVAYAVVPTCPNAFNGYSGVNFRTMLASHEIAEGVTDPYYTASPAYNHVDAGDQVWGLILGAEVGDMCDSAATGLTAEVTPPDLAFKVTRVWSNSSAAAGHDPCQPTTEPYYNTFPELPSLITLATTSSTVTNRGIQIAQGASATFPIDLYSDVATDTWTLSAVSVAQLKGLPANLQFTFDKPSGKNGDRVNLTIKVLSANTAQHGEIFYIKSTKQTTTGLVTHDWLGVVGS